MIIPNADRNHIPRPRLIIILNANIDVQCICQSSPIINGPEPVYQILNRRNPPELR
jgi:hypothetical protein